MLVELNFCSYRPYITPNLHKAHIKLKNIIDFIKNYSLDNKLVCDIKCISHGHIRLFETSVW